jgi:hypothetical protein
MTINELSYQEMIDLYYNKSTDKGIRYYIKHTAQEKHPSEYKQNDFKRIKKYMNYSYDKFISIFASAESSIGRSHCKGLAKRYFPNEFKNDDFPSPIFKIKSYEEMKNLHGKENKMQYRYYIRKICKKTFGSQYNEIDFPKRKNEKIKSKTYQEIIDEYNKSHWPRSGYIKTIAKKKFNSLFSTNDFPNRKIQYKTFSDVINAYLGERNGQKKSTLIRCAQSRFKSEYEKNRHVFHQNLGLTK